MGGWINEILEKYDIPKEQYNALSELPSKPKHKYYLQLEEKKANIFLNADNEYQKLVMFSDKNEETVYDYYLLLLCKDLYAHNLQAMPRDFHNQSVFEHSLETKLTKTKAFFATIHSLGEFINTQNNLSNELKTLIQKNNDDTGLFQDVLNEHAGKGNIIGQNVVFVQNKHEIGVKNTNIYDKECDMSISVLPNGNSYELYLKMEKYDKKNLTPDIVFYQSEHLYRWLLLYYIGPIA